MISDFHCLRPFWLVALLIPPFILWMASRAGDFRSRWKGLIAPHLLDSLIVQPDRRHRYAPAWVLSALLTLAILGAAGPTWKREAPPFVADTASLVIAVDLSPTMDAIDIPPSRIERVKLKIHDLLAARTGARTAVVAYSGTAHLVVPLTDDIELIETYTDALATGIMPKPGRDTAAALKLADDLLKRDGTSGTIALLTDGVEPAAFAGAKEIGSAIVVLGVGTSQGGAVKQRDGSFLSAAGGARLTAKLDVDALKKFGSDTGADVATITPDDTDVRWLAQRVRTNFAQQTATEGDRWHDLGWWFIAPVALLSALSFRRGWLVRLSAGLLAIHLLSPTSASAFDLANMWLTPDQQGRRAYQQGDYPTAADHFQDPMWKGAALYRAARYQDSIDAFASIDTPESWYNQGNALLHLNKFEEAVAAYGKALTMRKDWPDAVANLAVAQQLLKQEKDAEQEQEQDPNQKPDSVQFDDKGNKGKAGETAVAEQTSEMWVKNIQVSPADLMARKFSIEAGGSKP
ncbi:VWA domain-containing protein (plasmid) [Rhizobium grahamii]|uniref:VWA domain-containing protein n=1 Tax=Rhizobium grahamii TaxID=1120045 RepID=A0A5Q0CCV4_9HYPH|nr:MULTISPECIES: VWA domain-containing protein [Rhizobium]QFY63165.1 VWA domain-containing protein [Rhizobium grahamii]QRM52073.1 VWA domain-containing protein [Rhizobium sp. BG6]